MPIISSVFLQVSIVVITAFGAALHGIRVLVPKATESSRHQGGTMFRPGIRRQLLLAGVFAISFIASTYIALIPQIFVSRESVLMTYWTAFLVCGAISSVIGGFVLRLVFHQVSGPRIHLSSAFVGSFVVHAEMFVITFVVAIVFTLKYH
jgi:hypothetical protein